MSDPDHHASRYIQDLELEIEELLAALQATLSHLDDGHPGQHACAEKVRALIALAKWRENERTNRRANRYPQSSSNNR